MAKEIERCLGRLEQLVGREADAELRERLLAEAESHLYESASAFVELGEDEGEAARLAVAQFGDPGEYMRGVLAGRALALRPESGTFRSWSVRGLAVLSSLLTGALILTSTVFSIHLTAVWTVLGLGIGMSILLAVLGSGGLRTMMRSMFWSGVVVWGFLVAFGAGVYGSQGTMIGIRLDDTHVWTMEGVRSVAKEKLMAEAMKDNREIGSILQSIAGSGSTIKLSAKDRWYSGLVAREGQYGIRQFDSPVEAARVSQRDGARFLEFVDEEVLRAEAREAEVRALLGQGFLEKQGPIFERVTVPWVGGFLIGFVMWVVSFFWRGIGWLAGTVSRRGVVR